MKLKEYLSTGCYKPIKLKKGETIFHEGDACISIAYIVDGAVKGVKSFGDGHENTLRILTKNDILGMSLVFSSHPYYNATFTTISNTILYKIPKEELLSLIEKDREFSMEFLSLLSDNSIELNQRIRLLSYKTIRERLCYFFYTEFKKNDELCFTISYTKTALAELMNVERASLSYELHRMIQEGIVENKGHQYKIINLKKIEEVI